MQKVIKNLMKVNEKVRKEINRRHQRPIKKKQDMFQKFKKLCCQLYKTIIT